MSAPAPRLISDVREDSEDAKSGALMPVRIVQLQVRTGGRLVRNVTLTLDPQQCRGENIDQMVRVTHVLLDACRPEETHGAEDAS